MAVEIPVVVDIQGAFEEAAKNVNKAMKPLQEKLSSSALNIPIKVGRGTKFAKELLNGTATTKQLTSALKNLERQIMSMSAAGGFRPGNLTKIEQDMLNIYTQLQYKIAGTDNVLKQFSATMMQAEGGAKKVTTALSGQSVALKNLTAIASSYMSVFGVLRLGKQIRDVTGELEYQRVALGHLIQDEEYGARLFERIKEAAIESPFRIKDLVTYTKQLAAYRIEQENLFQTTSRLADISAGLGVDMNRLILAYGQVRAASVLRGQELRQFTEAGIPLVELLAEKMSELNNKSYTTADVFKLISERMVPFSAISDIFVDLTEKGGMFFEMQERQAETLKGRWEKLKDAFDIGLQAAGETKTFEWQNKLVLDILNVLAKNIRIVPKLIEAMGYAWATYSVAVGIANLRNRQITKSTKQVMTAKELLGAGVSKTTIRMLGYERVSKLVTKANVKLAASNGILSKSFAKLTLAMLSNPYTAIAAAVVGLASTFIFWRKKTDETTTSLNDMDDAIEQIAKDTEKYERGNKLIAQYEKLASKTERTTTENNKLQKTMSLLADVFPELTEEIYGENKALADNVKLLKDRNKYLIDKSKEGAGEKLVTARAELAKADKEIAELRKKEREERKEAVKYLDKYKYEDLLPSQQRRYDKLNRKADEAEAKLIDAQRHREQVAKRIETLEKYINPAASKGFDTAWQNTIARLKDVKSGSETISLISDEDIRGYESLYKAMTKIDKLYKDSAESVKEMRAGMSSVSAEYRDQAKEEIAIETARRNGYKAILDAFGYTSSLDKKRGVTDLTLLKEELKTVQDIYKKYQEFEKYLGAAGAKKEIEKIYGSVTAIDFLSPDAYKKRLEDILAELRKLQNRANTQAVQLSEEAFKDIRETIKKNEGFLGEAYKLPGEKGYTIGYGFYDTLPDGKKVAEGMKMTREEAEKLLDLAIEQRLRYVNKQIEKYGEGLVFNEKQMNVLLDLAFQSGSGVERVLKAAKGDANQIVEELKTAASEHLLTKDANIKAGVKKRDMRRAEAFRLAMAEAAEDENEIAEAIGSAEKLVQDVDWDEMKRALEKKLKQLEEDLKRSEAARDFYKNILNLTGDEEMATNLTVSVYGGIGEDFKERLQRELYTALKSIPADQLSKELSDEFSGAITTMDSKYMRENIEKLPEYIRDTFKKALDEYDEYNAKVMKGYAELLMKYDDVKHQEIDIENEYRHAIETIDEGLAAEKKGILENEVKENQEAATKMAEDRAAAAKKIAGLDKELKLSRLKKEYKLFFSSVGLMSEEAARKVVKEQKEILLKQFLIDGNFTKYRKEIKALDEQLEKYTKNQGLLASYLSGGIDAATSKLSEFSDRLSALSGSIFDKDGMLDISEESITFINKLGKIFGGSMFGVSGRKNVWDQILEKYKDEPEKIKEALADAAEEIQSKAQNFQQAMFWVDFWVGLGGGAINALGEIASYNKKVTDEFTDEWNTVARVILDVMSFGAADTWATDNQMDRLLALNEKALSGYQKFKSGDILGSLVDNIIGWSEVFGKSTKAIDREIEKQSKTIEDLDYQYSRLEKSIQKDFGSDYIADYNKQLDVLYAKQEAYLQQAALEESKPKKKRDAEKIEDYKKQAREVADQIADMESQLSEFFSGTDLTSAAKDFATAWIDAYKEFGSTTDAMKEKFQDMVQEMVTNSLAARVMQNLLDPIFKQIDELSQEGGELSAQDIATIAAAANAIIPNINDAMTTLMGTLNTAGYNIRQQAGQFTGIKRNIANATEESITGLAAGVNTQNFYMSYVPIISANVAAIVTYLTGDSTQTSGATPITPTNSELMMGHLDSLDRNLGAMLDLLRQVTTNRDGSFTNSKSLAIRMS